MLYLDPKTASPAASMEFLEIPFYDDDVLKLIVRMLFDVVFLAAVVFLSYYPRNRNQNYVFSFVLMNLTVFFICFTLKKLELELGMALGLFAIFSILRFRTDQIKVKDMTYMFIVIGIAVINALSNKKTSYAELTFANAAIVAAAMLFEFRFLERKKPKPTSQNIVYNNISLLAPNLRDQLLDDIRKQTGIAGTRVKVQNIDLTNQSANIVVYYNERTVENDERFSIPSSEAKK